MKPTLPDGLPAKVLECIQLYTSPDKRIRREHICAYCNSSDRQVRLAIEYLRNEGHSIISESGVPGYYFRRSDVEIVTAELRSRAYKLLNTARALERGREVGQMELAL